MNTDAYNPNYASEKMYEDKKLLSKIKPLPLDQFPENVLVSDLLGLSVDGRKMDNDIVTNSFNTFLKQDGDLKIPEITRINNALSHLAFPVVSGKSVETAHYKLCIKDVKDLIRERNIHKLNGFAYGGFNLDVIKILFNENTHYSQGF
ncbi:hypothetical protein ACFL0F_00085 [Patescibacteria group bacterium]